MTSTIFDHFLGKIFEITFLKYALESVNFYFRSSDFPKFLEIFPQFLKNSKYKNYKSFSS